MTEKQGITEAQFQAQVRQLAATFGFSVYCTWRPIHSPAGYPDLCLAKPGRLIYAELKSEKGKLSEKQEEWLRVLGATVPGVETYCWKPCDWEAVVEILRTGKALAGKDE